MIQKGVVLIDKKYRKFDGFTTNAWRRPEDKGGGGTIEEIQRNGVPLPIEDKTVDIEVPEKTSELQNDGEGGSPFATKEYVDQNAGAITAIKRNGSLLPITDKTVDVVVPTKTSELVNDSDFISVGDAATLSVFKIPGGDGGEETTTVIEEELNKLSLNYYKNAQGKLSDSVNMTFGDEDYFSLATTAFVQVAISNAVPSVQTDGNWTYKIFPDNTFEAWFRQTGLSYAITATSGSWYRSEPMSLAAPQALYDAYDLDITFANVQVGHANYPTICSSPTFYATGVNYYVLSGNTRPQASNYTLTCYMRGTLAAKS